MSREVLEIKKNCDNCIRKPTCKFLRDYDKLTRSNEFYEMFEYLEWNNLDKIFKDNASSYKCYHPTFPNGPLNYDLVGRKVFEVAVRKYLGNTWEHWQHGENKDSWTMIKKDGTPVTVEEIEAHYEVKIVNKYTTTNA